MIIGFIVRPNSYSKTHNTYEIVRVEVEVQNLGVYPYIIFNSYWEAWPIKLKCDKLSWGPEADVLRFR